MFIINNSSITTILATPEFLEMPDEQCVCPSYDAEFLSYLT
jgi:hypothetical protein